MVQLDSTLTISTQLRQWEVLQWALVINMWYLCERGDWKRGVESSAHVTITLTLKCARWLTRIETVQTEKLLSMKKYHVNGTRKSPPGSLLIKSFAFIWQRAQRLIYIESFSIIITFYRSPPRMIISKISWKNLHTLLPFIRQGLRFLRCLVCIRTWRGNLKTESGLVAFGSGVVIRLRDCKTIPHNLENKAAQSNFPILSCNEPKYICKYKEKKQIFRG